MLSVFPSLLIPFLAPVLLRLIVALSFGASAWIHVSRKDELKPMGVLLWLAIVIEILITISLVLGAYAQVAALAAAGMAAAYAVYAKKYPRAVPLCRGEYILLAVISLSLVLSGPGAFAQDLPL